MADITQLQDLELSQSSTATNPVVTVARKISDSETDLITSSTLVDKDGSTITKACILGIRKANGYVENVYIAAAGITGTAVTITTRGLKLGGIDFTATLAGNAVSHEQGEEVFLNVSPFELQQITDTLKGDIATGGTEFKIGDDTDVDVTLTAFNGDANLPFFQYASATSEWLYSNNGVDTTPFGTGAGVTGGDGITVTAGDIDIDTTDTTVFVSTTAGAGDVGKAPILDAVGQLDDGFIPLANQSEAETGTDDTVFMTPLKTKQAIDINVITAKSYSEGTSTTGILTTTTTADFIVTLDDTTYTRYKVDLQIGADESHSGTNGKIQRMIIEGVSGYDLLSFQSPSQSPVSLTSIGTFPLSTASVTISTSASATVTESGGSGTATITLNSITIVGNELRINYTSSVDTPADSGVNIVVHNLIVSN